MSDGMEIRRLPAFLREQLVEFAGAEGAERVCALMRPEHEVMRVDALKCFKASRMSFADLIVRKMAGENWRIVLLSSECDHDGAGKFVYRIETPGHAFTYIARAYPWDGIEKVGRRADGANRDMFGALFVDVASEDRIAQEFDTFDVKEEGGMRTDADVIGWTPANRSSRHFDAVVDALAEGRQPDPEAGLGYLMRNGGFQASGRNGSISYQGLPEDHPLNHPFFADLFAIYLVRVFSLDFANAVARLRNPDAAQLAPEIARELGIGNSSGQGMCVALQRWPHWVATWVTVRELALAYAKAQPVTDEGRARMRASIARAEAFYARTDEQTESYVISNERMLRDLKCAAGWLGEATFGTWGDFTDRAAATMNGESQEQLNSLLMDLVPGFCDAIAPYLRIGASRQRVADPAMPVGDLRAILRRNYGWALKIDRAHASTHQHFWYHSVDNGEQRRGERIVDPHEHFESFIDHVGLIQRLASVLTAWEDDAKVGDVVMACPDLHYAVSRVQYLDGLPYAEIRDSIAHRDFLPSNLIRFFLACLGVRCATPLSIRYVRGTFYQFDPLPPDFAGQVDTGPETADTKREIAL